MKCVHLILRRKKRHLIHSRWNLKAIDTQGELGYCWMTTDLLKGSWHWVVSLPLLLLGSRFLIPCLAVSIVPVLVWAFWQGAVFPGCRRCGWKVPVCTSFLCTGLAGPRTALCFLPSLPPETFPSCILMCSIAQTSSRLLCLFCAREVTEGNRSSSPEVNTKGGGCRIFRWKMRVLGTTPRLQSLCAR